MDETYIKVKGIWMYLYRAVDSMGNTIDYLLRKHRDGAAAKAFFHKAFKGSCYLKKLTIDKRGINLLTLNSSYQTLPGSRQIEIRQVKA